MWGSKGMYSRDTFSLLYFGINLMVLRGFPGGLVVKIPSANARDAGDSASISGLGRSPGGGNGNPLQFSLLENFTDREASGYSPWGHERVRHN